MRLKSLLSVTALLAAGLVALPLSAANADTTGIVLPLTGYYQMAVDAAHGHLFFSQGSSSKNSILVTDFAGKTVKTITGQTAVKGIALSPDGSTLYAALSGAHAVTAIDTTTLTQTASYSVGDANTPQDVAVQSGRVWVSYNTGTYGNSAIGDFDLAVTSPAFVTPPAMAGWYEAPMLAADPADDGNVLVAMDPAQGNPPVASYNTAPNPATLRKKASQLTQGPSSSCQGVNDLAVAPGGAEFIAACSYPYAHFRYSTADLSQQGSYASATNPSAIAIASGTGLVAAGVNNPGTNIFVYPPGGDTTLTSYQTPQTLEDRGLALTPDGSELFAVTSDATNYYLNVYNYPNAGYTTLALNGPARVNVGSAVALTGTLAFGGAVVPDGTSVAVTRSGPGGTLAVAATTTGGAFTVSDTPAAPGSYTYTASYAGDGTNSAATAAVSVTVNYPAPALTLSATPGTASYEPTVHLTAHLGTTATNRTVTINAKPLGGGTTVKLASAAVNSAGNLTVSYPAMHSATYSAVFTGDARYSPKTVTVTAYVSADVTLTISGSYGTKKVGSTTFRLYHHTARLNVAALVAPNKHGQCVKFEVQEHYKGAWRASSVTSCGVLSRLSMAAGYLTLIHADLGYGYRIRVDYLRGSDVSNLNADSLWQYFMVEK